MNLTLGQFHKLRGESSNRTKKSTAYGVALSISWALWREFDLHNLRGASGFFFLNQVLASVIVDICVDRRCYGVHISRGECTQTRGYISTFQGVCHHKPGGQSAHLRGSITLWSLMQQGFEPRKVSKTVSKLVKLLKPVFHNPDWTWPRFAWLWSSKKTTAYWSSCTRLGA